MELRQSSEWGKFLEKLGWQTEIIDDCAVRIKKLGLFGSVIKIQRPENLPLERIEVLAKNRQALFVKIEPINNSRLSILNYQLFKFDSWPLTPPRTVHIDLTQIEEELWKSFSKDTRQTLKKPQDSRLKIQEFDFEEIDEKKEKALQDFYQIFKETGKRGGFWVQPYSELLVKVQAFGFQALLILASSNQAESGGFDRTEPGRPSHQLPDPGSGPDNQASETPVLLAGCLLLFCDGVAYYHHAASTLEGQELETPYAIMWRAILESKKRNMKKLDLEGIFDPRFKFMNTRAWHNFSTFKLKWGGQIYEYSGSYLKVYNPLVRALFWLESFLS